MSLNVVGQRCVSEREPELGLGQIVEVDKSSKRVTVEFPATNERRIYALGTPVLKRVQFRAGESVSTRAGDIFTVETVEEENGLLVYLGGGKRVREDAISDVTSVSLPQERLLAGQADPSEVFDLRLRALQAQAKFRQSEVRGFLGGRLQLIPHQFYILQEVTSRQVPRVLLADEVGLGKTIEACLILQRLLAVGKVKRALILVPESLTHQWFVELLRRFNLWFSIYDTARCNDLEASDPAQNPFLSSQLALTSVSFLAGDEKRRDQALAAGWDIVVVDEAHHLAWSPESPSAEYKLVEQLAQKTAGLLLLTATPTQLGLEGHFARLRLLDPKRFDDLESFRDEAESFESVADVAERIIEGKPLKPKDHKALNDIFVRDPEGLAEHLAALDKGAPGARDALLKSLIDQHGTGRAIFRNTRAAMTGFPKRKFSPVAIEESNLTQLARVARELSAEEEGRDAEVRYSFKEDARIDWLVEFLQKNRSAKVLLIGKSQRKVAALEAALREKTAIKIGFFHEGLELVQRDRQAAWFAEPDGAQMLICSEIGSEGRNFQFAHHLVLWDVPLNPGLLEQRIGRLDRIGQTETIRVHVPYFKGSAEECIVEWYHRGLDAFETSLHGGNDYQEKFKTRLLALADDFANGETKKNRAGLNQLIADTEAFRTELSTKMKQGRDRLLELNSFNPAIAAKVIERVRAVDADPFLRAFLIDLLDHFGVRIKEDENGDVTLDPSHAYVDSFPSINADGMLATFSRERAIAREDITFISPDHALVQNAIDLLIDSKSGTTAFAQLEGDKPNLLLEAVFVLETVADSKWHVDQFLAPTPVRVLVDIHGKDLSDEPSRSKLAKDIEDAPLPRFLSRPGFNGTLLKNLVEGAADFAEKRAQSVKKAAREKAATVLTADLQRLVDLSKLNDQVRPEEIELAKKQVLQTRTAIEQARLRLDCLRLVVEGVPVE